MHLLWRFAGRTIVQHPLASGNGENREEHGAASLEKVLNLLSKLSDSFHGGNIEYSVYKRLRKPL